MLKQELTSLPSFANIMFHRFKIFRRCAPLNGLARSHQRNLPMGSLMPAWRMNYISLASRRSPKTREK